MADLPTPDQRRRSLLLLRHVERTLMTILEMHDTDETRERLRRVRERIAEVER